MSNNRRLSFFIWLCVLGCVSSFDVQNVTTDDKILSEEEARYLINNKLEQLSLVVHRKNEGDRIRKKRQFDANYHLPSQEDEFSSVSLKTIVSDIEPVESLSKNEIFEDASSWSTVENPSNISLFWTRKQNLNPYNSAYDRSILNYATLNPDLKKLAIHYSAPDTVQTPSSIAIKSKQFNYFNRYFVVLYSVDVNRFEIVAYKFEQVNYPASGPSMKRTQSLSFANSQVDFDLIQYQGNVYLSVSVGIGEVRLYKWNRIQFDLVADQKSELLIGVDSVKLFKMSGTVYIATLIISKDIRAVQLFSYQDTGKIYDSLRLMQKINLNTSNYSPIIKMDKRSSKIEFFSVHGNHYLVFIGPFDCKVFWWLKSQFIEFQRIPNSAYTKDVDIAYMPSNEVIISLVTYNNDLKFFTESVNGEFVPTFTRHFESRNQLIQTATLVPFRKTHYFVFFTHTKSSQYQQPIQRDQFHSIYHLNLTLVKAFKERSDQLMSCLDRLNHNLKRSEELIRRLKDRTSDVWVRNREQTIVAPVIVHDNAIVRSPAKINYMKIKSTSPIPRGLRAINIRQNMNKLQQLINNHQKEFDTNVLLKSRIDQRIESPVNFVVPVASNNVVIDEINEPRLRINNVSYVDLMYNTLKRTGNQIVNAPFTFANNVKINKLNVRTINGLNLNDVLLSQSNQVQNVTGRYEFRNVFVNGNIQLQDTLNRLRLDQLARLNAPQPIQIITGDKVFNILDLKAGLKVSGLVNNGDVRNLEQNAIKLNSSRPQICYGKLVFLKNIETNDLDVHLPINERVSLDEMLISGLRKNSRQTVIGNVKFNNLVTVSDSLKTDGLVNNLNIETDLLNLHKKQEFDGELIFKRPVSMLKNFTAFMVNSINFTNEIVYRNSPVPQFVTSHKTFNQDIFFGNNLTMNDKITIDFVDPSELVKNSLNNGKRMFGAVVFDNLRILGNVQTNRLNEISIPDLITKYWLKDTRQSISQPVQIRSPIKIQKLNVHKLNNHLFPGDYVVNKPNTHQLITGSKVFVNAAVMNGSFVTSTNTTVNGLNLDRLDSRIVQNLQLINKRDNSTLTDFISGHKKFQTLEVEGNLYVNRLNGMRLEEDVLLRNSPFEQVISGKKNFGNNPYVNVKGSIGCGNGLYIKKSINRINLTEWLQDIVLKSSPEIANRAIINKQFTNRVDTHEIDLFGRLSEFNFTDLINRAVYVDGRLNDINVPIIFDGSVQFDRARILRKMNNLDLPIYERSLIYKRNSFNRRNQPVIITGNTNILGTLSIEGNLKSAYPLTTVDLNKLRNRMLSKTRINVINAPFVFEHDSKANRFDLIGLNTKINNVNLNDFVRLDKNITLPGRLVIEDALDIMNGLHIQTGSINQFNINEIYRNAVNRFGNVYLGGNYGDVIFKYLDVNGNMHTKNQLLDDIHLENEYRSKVIDANNVIETPLIFTDSVSVGNLIVRNRINDVRLDYIIKDAVLRSVPQTISGPKMFTQNVVPKNKFTVHTVFNVTGLLNRIRLDVLYRILIRRSIGLNSEIFSSKYFNKPVHFERDLQVLGTINKLRLPTDLVLSRVNEFINSTVVFKQPVEFINQLDILRTYNGYPVRNSFIDRVDLNKHNLEYNPIRSGLVFNDRTVIGELIVLRSINGIPINLLLPANLVGSRNASLLKGKFVFDGNVRIKGDLNVRDNVLNKINLINLATQTIRINSNDYLPGRVIIDRRLTFNRTRINKKLNGISIQRFRNYYLAKKVRQEKYFQGVMNNLITKDQRLGKQVDGAFNKISYLEYFENYDEFDSLDANGRELIFDRFLTTPFVFDNQFDESHIMHPTIEHLTAWRIVNRKNSEKRNANNYCDHYETWTYVLNEYDDLILQSDKIVHRAFPAFKLTFKPNAYSMDDDENTFYLWSNTTGCHLKRNPYDHYAKENIPYEVTLLYTSQFTEIGKMKRRITDTHSHKPIDKSAIGRLDSVSAVMEDARFFTDKNNNHYSFVAYSYSKVLAHSLVNSTLYEFNQKKNKWSVRQQLPSEGAVAVDMVHYYPPNSIEWYGERNQNQRITLLAIANRLSKYDQSRRNLAVSSVYAFDDNDRQLKLIAQLPTFSPKSVLFVPIFKNLKYMNSSIIRQVEHDDLFLVYANEKLRYYDECSTQEDLTLERTGSSRSSLFNQGVSIYRVSRTNLTFTLHQQLDVVGSITLDKFYLPSNQAYIVIGSKILHKTFVYYYDRSVGQFVIVQTISTPAVENVKIFWSKSGNLYLVIASSKPGASKRLKAVINGPNPLYLRNIFEQSY